MPAGVSAGWDRHLDLDSDPKELVDLEAQGLLGERHERRAGV
jgi:hypothetical protein